MDKGDDTAALVIDVGTHSAKFGFAGEDCPKQISPSFLGVPNGLSSLQDATYPLSFGIMRENMGVRQVARNDNLNVSLDDEAFEVMVRKTLCSTQGFNLDLTQHPIMLAEPSRTDKEYRKKIVEIMFEKFQVPAAYVAKRAVLCTFASGRASAVVLDSGAACTTCTPVVEGFALQRYTKETILAGDLLDREVMTLLANGPRKIDPVPLYAYKRTVRDGRVEGVEKVDVSRVDPLYYEYGRRDLAQKIKESVCRVAEDDRDVMTGGGSTATSASFELPDGQALDVNAFTHRIPECMFNPKLVTCQNLDNIPAVNKLIHETVIGCDVDIRKDLMSGIIVTGGNTLFPGFEQKLHKKLCADFETTRLKVIAPAASVERRFASWIGGSILASLGSFQQMWISKQEFDEKGAEWLVEKKCP
eukprot:GDKI01049176.1.p1 GENE.GDKI01049176.1~~GDKI01049176.1.p1  ORF type:complete len:416 (+),score=106.53 GDKI01049176.1:67-1314(+)